MIIPNKFLLFFIIASSKINTMPIVVLNEDFYLMKAFTAFTASVKTALQKFFSFPIFNLFFLF